MVVTIEPGFYQVDALLNDPERRANFDGVVNWERLEDFRDVRGIRIEDDVLVTETGSEVLTAALPTDADFFREISNPFNADECGRTPMKWDAFEMGYVFVAEKIYTNSTKPKTRYFFESPAARGFQKNICSGFLAI